MRLEGTWKIHSSLGVEYQFGEFSINQECLVFEQNYSFGGKKRKIFPLKILDAAELHTNKGGDLLSFSCDNLEFELDGSSNREINQFMEELKTGLASIKRANSGLHYNRENKERHHV